MNTKTKISLLGAALILCVTSTAFADKLCLQTTVNRKTLRATNRSVVAATCPKGFTELADTSRFQGPAGASGATGAQGPAGIVNLAACRIVSNSCIHSAGLNECSVNCTSGTEFRLQYSFLNVGSCDVNLDAISGPQYSNGVYGGITVFTGASCPYDTEISAICCPLT